MALRRTYRDFVDTGSEMAGLALPYTQADAPVKPLVVCHHRGSSYTYASGAGSASVGGTPTRNVAKHGFAAVFPDGGGATTWAADPAKDRVADAVSHLVGRTICDPGEPMYGIGVSMGSHVLPTYVRDGHVADFAALALCLPVLDLATFHDTNRGGFKSEINTAYGGEAAFQAAVPTHSPMAFVDELADIPIGIWYAENDELALKSEALTFAALHGNCETFEVRYDAAVLPLTPQPVNHGAALFYLNFDEIAAWLREH